MTSHSGGSHQNNEDMILVSSSSSEDEGEEMLNTFSFMHTTSRDRRSIRELVREGKRLLMLAEQKSRPEEYRNDAATIYRYNFSSAVTGCDLFRDRELAELAEIVSSLKIRLSAERVFALGCPQLRSERDVFDELLMRYSDELLDIRQGTHSIDGNIASRNIDTERLPLEHGNSSSGANSTNNSIIAGHSSLITQNTNDQVLHVPFNQPERILDEVHSAGSLRDVEGLIENADGIQENAETSNSVSQSENGNFLTNINNSALPEFFRSVSELKLLTSSAHTPACDRIPHAVVIALQASLSSLMKTSLADSSLGQPELVTSRQRKRTRSEEEGSSEIVKKQKTNTSDSKQDDEDKEEDSCSICLEPWSTGGDHRVTCLKCGHLFGKSCILKWIEQAHCCPQCKERAKKNDIRNIFVAKITAEDTSQRDRAIRLLEEEKQARRTCEQKEAMARKKLEMQAADIEVLKTKISQLEAQNPENGKRYFQPPVVPKATGSMSSSQSTSSKRFQQFQRVSISADGQCRVFDHCQDRGLVVVSLKSPNTLFRGFGIRILTRDFRLLSYQPLHSAPIRDMCFRPGAVDGLLLSCGLDKSLQLTSVTSQVVVQKYTVNSSVWCCAWNTQNTNLFYAGMERGVVKEFDIRRTDSHVQDVLEYGGSPISTIQYWNGPVNEVSLQGLLIGHLQSLIFGEQANGQFTTHQLPHLQAPLMSLSLHPSGMYMSSFRPGSHFPKSRYEICSLSQSSLEEDVPRTVSSSCQAMWEGSNMQAVISRNSLITRPESEDGLLAVTANHSNNAVSIWDYNKKQDFQTLPCFDRAIDIKLLHGDLLGVLTDKDLLLYNWRV